MKIQYIPTEDFNEDSITKYDLIFTKGEVKEVEEVKALKLIQSPYFHEPIEGDVEVIVADKTKRKRRTKAEMNESN